MAKQAKGGCLRAAMKETQYMITTPPAEVRDEKKHGIELQR